jgi:glutathione peroxidase-type tryparedoxin peroxidase
MNVASKCGFTKKGYTAATELYDKYEGKNFRVLAFPCNQFGGQEPGTNEEIAAYACTRWDAKFPLMGKVDVNGEKADPFWAHIKTEVPGLLWTTSIKWNFTSFVIDQNGNVIDRWMPGATAASLEKVIAPLLAQ